MSVLDNPTCEFTNPETFFDVHVYMNNQWNAINFEDLAICSRSITKPPVLTGDVCTDKYKLV